VKLRPSYDPSRTPKQKEAPTAYIVTDGDVRFVSDDGRYHTISWRGETSVSVLSLGATFCSGPPCGEGARFAVCPDFNSGRNALKLAFMVGGSIG
jgi:hypothetical protein